MKRQHQHTRYFPKLDKPEEKIEESFGVPKNTLLSWKKHHNYSDNYRGYFYDKLAVITKLEENVVAKLKTLFTQKELMALWGSLNGTMEQMHLFETPQALSNNFRDYCYYEAMEAQQFTDDELQLFANRVGEKLDSLVEFEKYVLFQFIKSDTGNKYIFCELETNKKNEVCKK